MSYYKRTNRFCAEFSIGMFEVDEDRGTLDLEILLNVGYGFFSFQGFLKVLFFAAAVNAMIIDLLNETYPYFYFAYLTKWTLLHQIIYLLLSMCVTLLSIKYGLDGDYATFLAKLAWLYYSLAMVHGLIVTVLYWATEWTSEKGFQYDIVMTNGGTFLICLINGMFLDRTPVRLKHVFINLIWAILYGIWSALQNLVVKHNPELDDDDDALYDVVRWQKDPLWAGISFAIFLLVAIPSIQLLLWACSLPFRIYFDDYLSEDEEGDEGEEERRLEEDEEYSKEEYDSEKYDEYSVETFSTTKKDRKNQQNDYSDEEKQEYDDYSDEEKQEYDGYSVIKISSKKKKTKQFDDYSDDGKKVDDDYSVEKLPKKKKKKQRKEYDDYSVESYSDYSMDSRRSKRKERRSKKRNPRLYAVEEEE